MMFQIQCETLKTALDKKAFALLKSSRGLQNLDDIKQ